MRVSIRQPHVRALLVRLLTAGLKAVDPLKAVRGSFKRHGAQLSVGAQRYDLRRYRRIVVVGAGKASAPMAQAVEGVLGDRVSEGLVVVKYGHSAPTLKVEILEAGHPVPDKAGERGAARLLSLARGLTSRDLLIVLISGGASSLLPAPSSGLTLGDKQRTTELLVRSGAAIQEVNAVRKHLSAIKGGRLAAATPATIVSLILSDVVGDDVGAIGSGPTAPDPTTYADAREIVHKYQLWSRLPGRVRTRLARGKTGGLEETPKPRSAVFRRVHNHLVGNNAAAVAAVAQEARRAGLHPLILSTCLTGNVDTVGKVFGAIAKEIVTFGRPVPRPACVMAGGELTVQVNGSGMGGRAQEFALVAALEIAGLDHVWVAAFGTDGTDGPTRVAGAVTDGGTVPRARRQRVDPLTALARNDSYHFFQRLGGHITTGPTRTNVNDLYLLLVL